MTAALRARVAPWRKYWESEKFSPQTLEPFAGWVSATYPVLNREAIELLRAIVGKEALRTGVSRHQPSLIPGTF